jgi:hypothetical protein
LLRSYPSRYYDVYDVSGVEDWRLQMIGFGVAISVSRWYVFVFDLFSLCCGRTWLCVVMLLVFVVVIGSCCIGVGQFCVVVCVWQETEQSQTQTTTQNCPTPIQQDPITTTNTSNITTHNQVLPQQRENKSNTNTYQRDTEIATPNPIICKRQSSTPDTSYTS